MFEDPDTRPSEGESDPAAKTSTGRVDYRSSYVDRISLWRALLAGVVGGVVFGIPLQFVIGRMGATGAMYTVGTPSIRVGWVAHLAHSALFGVLFGMVTELNPLHSWMVRNIGVAGLVGIGFATGLYAINIVVIWPTWLQTVGYPPAVDWSIPHTPLLTLLGHLLWGSITGPVFYLLVDY